MCTHRLLVSVLVPGFGGALLIGCSSGTDSVTQSAQSGDIGKVVEVASSFGPDFKVDKVDPTGIDPKLLAAQRLPNTMKFDPPDCAEFASGQNLPTDLKGNMAAVTAEGAGNRFITIAMETSQEVPFNPPSDHCKKVSFAGGALRGTVEAVPAPQIDGVQTTGAHRVLQATIDGKPQTGEVYSYLAHFGNFQVIVTANPLVVPDKPPVPVDTKKAEELLTSAVAAVQGQG